jgi:PAS domain S-box-containing protein
MAICITCLQLFLLQEANSRLNTFVFEKWVPLLGKIVDMESNLQEAKYQWWAKRNAEFILATNSDEEVLSITGTVTSLLGLATDDLSGKRLDSIFHPLDLPVIRKILRDVVTDPLSEHFCHVRGWSSSEVWVWLEVTAINQLENPELSALMLVVKVMKLTREPHGTGSLHRIHFKELFRSISDGLLIHTIRGDNTIGVFIEANDVACRMLGYSHEELLQLSPNDINNSRSEVPIEEMIKKVVSGETIMFETVLQRKDGSVFPVEIQTNLFRTDEQLAVIAQVRDITIKREAEQARLQAEHRLKESVDELQQVNRRLRTLRRIDKAINHPHWNEQEVNEIALHEIRELIPCEKILVFKVNNDTREMLITARMDGDAYFSGQGKKLPADIFPLDSLKDGKTEVRRVTPESARDEADRLLLAKGLANSLSVPFIHGGHVDGLFVMLAGEKDAFSDVHIEIAEEIAGQLYLNMTKRELNRKLERYARDLEQLVEERTKIILKLGNLHLAILKNAGLGILTTDASGIIQTVNPAAEQMLGYPANDLIGKANPLQFHDPSELMSHYLELGGGKDDALQRVFAVVTQDILQKTTSWTYIRKDGSFFPVRLTISSYNNAEGEVEGYIGMIMDVTLEMQPIESLRRSEERLNKMFRDHSAIMYLFDPVTGDIMEANQSAIRFYGYNFFGERKINLKDINVLPYAQVRLMWETQGSVNFNYYILEHKLANGEIRTVEVHSSPIESVGQFLRFSIIHDVTERKRIEAELVKREAENRAILMAVPDMLFRLNGDGLFLSCNSGSIPLYTPNEQFVGKRIDEVMPPEIAIPGHSAVKTAIETGGMASFEYQLDFNGDVRYFENRTVSISESEVLAIIRDVTAQRKAEKTLHRSESLLRKMASSSPMGFFVVDNRTDEILYFNHQFCEIWGIEPLEERMTKNELKNGDVIPFCISLLKDAPAFEQSCKPLQSEFNETVVEDEIPFIDGRTIRRFSAQIRGEQNEYFGRLYIFEDITRRKSTEQFVKVQRDLATQLSVITSMDQALMFSLTTMLQIEEVDGGGIYLYNNETESFDLAAHQGLSPDFIADTSFFGPESKQVSVVKAGIPKYISSEALGSVSPMGLQREGLLSLAVIPMLFEGNVIGCINLASRSMSGFYDNIRFLLEALAMQIAGAISRINVANSLLRSQQNFQSLFDTLGDFMFILDAGGMIIRTNLVVQNRLGYMPEELNTMHVLEVHPPERREEAGFIVNEMLAGRALFCPVPLIAKDGRYIPVETRVVLGKWDGKTVLFGISRDISERLKSEAALLESEARWNFALEGSGAGVWDWDLNTNTVFYSTQWKRMFGYEEQEIGNTLEEWQKRVHPEDLELCHEDLNRHFKRLTDIYENEHRVLCKDGTYLWILDRGKVVSWKEDHTPARIIGTHSDISERKVYEKALQESAEKEKELSRVKSKFISVASHEFRTPLATILAASESLVSYRKKMSEIQIDERLGKIKTQVSHINRIIEEVLDLSKLQVREKELEPVVFDLSALTYQIIEEFREQVGANIGIGFNSIPEHVEVLLDKNNIQLIIRNLISNAVKYSDTGATVLVGIRGYKHKIILTVKDEGIGIPDGEKKHLFTPFFRASNAENISGTGLGLNIVNEAVSRHGGTISVQSELNQGSLFTIQLPRTITVSNTNNPI